MTYCPKLGSFFKKYIIFTNTYISYSIPGMSEEGGQGGAAPPPDFGGSEALPGSGGAPHY